MMQKNQRLRLSCERLGSELEGGERVDRDRWMRGDSALGVSETG